MTKIMVQLDRKRRETPWLLVLSATLFFATLVHNSLTWAALSRIPEIGQRLEYHAGLESPLTWTYLKLGRAATNALGLTQLQVEASQQAFAGALTKAQAEPEKTVGFLLAERGAWRATLLPWSHYGCPLLLLAWILFTWMRPAQLNTYNARR